MRISRGGTCVVLAALSIGGFMVSRGGVHAILPLLASPVSAQTNDITVLCSNGFKAVMEQLAPQFERTSHRKVAVRYDLAANLKREIESGQAFDVAILTPTAIDDLIKAGKTAADSRTVLARSGLGIAIRAGAAKPDISTVDAFKRSLRAAKGIVYAREGASGVAFVGIVERIGLAADIKSQMRPLATGEEVADAVVKGDAQFAVLPVSEIQPIRGAQLLGAFPADIQSYIVMVAVAGTNARDGRAARDLIVFLNAPSSTPVVTAKGMERPK